MKFVWQISYPPVNGASLGSYVCVKNTTLVIFSDSTSIVLLSIFTMKIFCWVAAYKPDQWKDDLAAWQLAILCHNTLPATA